VALGEVTRHLPFLSSLVRNVPYFSSIEVSPVVYQHESRRRGGGNVESSPQLRAFQGRGETVENRDRGKFLPVLAPRPVFHPASTARHFHGLSLPPTPHGFFRTARILR
jgi:hypothetical protein